MMRERSIKEFRGHASPSRILMAGVVVGVLVYLAAFLWFWGTSEFGFMGQESEVAQAYVEEHFLPDYLFFNGKLLVISLVLGGVCGLFSSLVLSAFSLHSSRSRWLCSLLLVCLLSLLLLARSVLLTPQLYWEIYAEQGPLSGWIDLVLDHGLPAMFNLGLALFALLALLGLRRLFNVGIALVVACLVALAGWWSHAPVTLDLSDSESPNVILVIVDSLRSDRLSGFSYERQTTPYIDALMSRADHFPNTYVSLPRTLPSIVSMMTGQLPMQHGVRTMFPGAEVLQRERIALAYLLHKKGYATAVVSDFAGEMFRDVNLGYEVIETPSFNFPAVYRQRSLEVQLLLLAWLNNAPGRVLLPELDLLPQNADPEVLTDKTLRVLAKLPQPFFLTVFYSATHFPYTAAYPDYLVFADPGYRGEFRFAVPYALDANLSRDPKNIEQVNALYDGALRGVDRAVGRLVDQLGQAGMLDRSFVILTGDHGENLYEDRSGLGHGDHFVGGLQSLRVPLLIAGPDKVEGQVIEHDQRMIDLLPTMVDVLGLEQSVLTGLHGSSVYSANGQPRSVYAETGLWMSPTSTLPVQKRMIEYPDILETGEVDFEHGNEIVIKSKYRNLVRTAKHRLYKEGPWVLVYMPTGTGVEYALYREDLDPVFASNLVGEFPEQMQSMREKLLVLMAMEPGVEIRNDFVVYTEE